MIALRRSKKQGISDGQFIVILAAAILIFLGLFFCFVYTRVWDEAYINALGGLVTLVGLFLQAIRSALFAQWKKAQGTITEKQHKFSEKLNVYAHPMVLVGAAIIAAAALGVFLHGATGGAGVDFRRWVIAVMSAPGPNQFFRGLAAIGAIVLWFVFVRWLLGKCRQVPQR